MARLSIISRPPGMMPAAMMSATARPACSWASSTGLGSEDIKAMISAARYGSDCTCGLRVAKARWTLPMTDWEASCSTLRTGLT